MDVHLLVCIVIFCNAINPSTSFNSSAFVQFDPYVSILDKTNRYRYNEADLIPLIAKVATKFSNIFIQLSREDVNCTELCTGLSLSLVAVANYNALFTKESPLQVWLGYSEESIGYRYKDKHCIYHQKPYLLINDLQSLANRANTIFKNTVTAIFLPYKILRNHLGKSTFQKDSTGNYIIFSSNQTWGVLLDGDACLEDQHFLTNLKHITPNIVVMVIPPVIQKSRNDPIVSKFKPRIEKCQDYVHQTEGSHLGFYMSIPDTESDNNNANLSGLTSTWNEAINWSENTKYPVILSKAFDTPYEKCIEQQTTGWWRLVENSRYNSTSQYIFEDKSVVAELEDMFEAKEFTWLKANKTFTRHTTGVIFSFFEKSRLVARSRHSAEEKSCLHKLVSQSFGNVVLLIADNRYEDELFLKYDLENIASLVFVGEKIDIVVLLMPHVNLIEIYQYSLKEAIKRFPMLSVISTYTVSFAGVETVDAANYMKNTFLDGIEKSSYTFGYSFNLSVCGSYEGGMSVQEKVAVDQTINDSDAQAFVFYFEETQETIKLGAERMYQQRIVLFEQCRNWLIDKKQGESFKLRFVMLHYSAQPEKFYSSKWEMDRYIRYLQMLSDWAAETDTIVTFNAIDGDRKLGRDDDGGHVVSELGWWRLKSAASGGPPPPDNKFWIDKKEDATIRFTKDIKLPIPSLSTGQILLAVLLPLFFLIVIIITSAFFITRRFYRETLLTKSELYEFLHGSELAKYEFENENAHYGLPYDKSRYEISKSNFTTELNGCLGAGEFGMVFRGTVKIGENSVAVAVKMVNPRKIHKTTLTGLLAEIKVLAHLEKHENVTELIGANTSDVMNGQVYIFLELCGLGSLEKFLLQQRPSVQGNDYTNVQEQEKTLDARVQKYLNLITIKSTAPLLEQSLSDNLHKWSREICSGMAYLASKHVVHADLATRNVLLSANQEAKICDFGLSRRMYNYTNYVKKQQEPLPWKWMSPESLRLLQFNEKSDVWAYGVTLWEIYTLGDKPYSGLSWSLTFAEELEHGLCLPQPKYNCKNMYDIMKECWIINPVERPHFADLQVKFQESKTPK